MTGTWEDVIAGEIGVGAKVTIFPFKEGKGRIEGVVDALWIPSEAMRSTPNEVRARVKVADEHGRWWIGPSTFLEAAI